jgi:hypothetical protein
MLTYRTFTRICVGRYVADTTIWLGIVSILAVFNISGLEDEKGRNVEVKYSDGVIRCEIFGFALSVSLIIFSSYPSHALPFPCSIVPRSEKAKKLILDCSADMHF